MTVKSVYYSVTAYYPSRLFLTPEGRRKEELIESLARKSKGRIIGGGNTLVGSRPLRDLQFAFHSEADANRFISRLKTRHIRRSRASRRELW